MDIVTRQPVGVRLEVLLNPAGWASILSKGTGMAWETFEPTRGNESFSHAWSAHPLYHQ